MRVEAVEKGQGVMLWIETKLGIREVLCQLAPWQHAKQARQITAKAEREGELFTSSPKLNKCDRTAKTHGLLILQHETTVLKGRGTFMILRTEWVESNTAMLYCNSASHHSFLFSVDREGVNDSYCIISLRQAAENATQMPD